MASSSTKSASKKKADKETSSKKLPKLPKEFIVRPHADSNEPKRAIANFFVSPQLLEITGWKAGEFVKLTKGLTELTGLVAVWQESDDERYSLDVVLVSMPFVKLASLLLGDRVELSKPSGAQPEYANQVDAVYFGVDERTAKTDLQEIGLIYSGLTLESEVAINGINEDLDSKMDGLTLDRSSARDASEKLTPYLYHPKSTKTELKLSETEIRYPPAKLNFGAIGGLDNEIAQLKKNIHLPLNCPEVFKEFGIPPPRGTLLYGPSGTGKSLLLNTVAYESPQCHIIKIDGPSIVSKYLGGTEERLRDYFKEAAKYAPSMVLIDEIDSLVPSRNSDDTNEVDSRVVATMLTLLDSIEGPVVVIGATNRPGAIDVSLRRPGRFDQELEITIPDADGRFDILTKQFSRMGRRSNLTTDQIQEVSSKTHGYVGADLVSLTREAIMRSISKELGKGSEEADLSDVKVSETDIMEAMQEIRPSAMREIVLEMPKVKWSDIGGQEVLKRKLREMVQLPLTASETFERLGISAPKGLLLYGPPGCSKTMTAKALASESGLNFLAIKGPEIFNKYVGESEKKIREIFRKARLSAPSIVFIDEIDAIATSRDSEEGNHVSQQVLNTMLNEIDGVEELKGVIIIGATNRPDSIDPALLRPGRLDRHVYVSPPDAEARRQIFVKNTEKFDLQDSDALLDKLVELSDGFSGSECVLLCQEAGLNAIMENSSCEKVDEKHFTNALKDISKNITPEMLEYYRDFAVKFSAAAI